MFEAKLHRKLTAQERANKRKASRLRKMGEDERRQHDAWQQTHEPGSKAKRARLRKERQDASAFKASIDAPVKRPLNPELEALEAELTAARQRAAAIKIKLAYNEGIFG